MRSFFNIRLRKVSSLKTLRAGVWFASLFALSCWGETSSFQKNVLVLHSYHQGLEWTDSITRGIQAAFEGTEEQFAIHFDYLDSKRNTTPEYFEELRTLFATKNRQINYDLLLISDNDALNFYLRNRELFPPDVPVVFCGINNYRPEMLGGAQNITGVAEKTDFKGTLELMMRLHPDARRITIINDRTTTGQEIKKNLLEVIPQFQNRMEFHFLEEFNLDTIADQLAGLGSDDLIYLLTLNKDSAGRFISYKYGSIIIRQSTQVPIYGSWDFYLGKGIVGGNIVSGYQQGYQAAEIGLRILNGEAVQNIPVVTTFAENYRFDARELQRFNIDYKLLPRGSDVMNRQGLCDRNEVRVMGVLLICLVCGIGVQSLRFYRANLRRTRLERDKEELDLKVEARTRELNQINQQLEKEVTVRRSVEEQLRESNLTKDKFLSIIAHDLKNPVCGLMSVTELLKDQYDEFDKEELGRLLGEMHSQSSSAFQLLENLLIWANVKQQRISVAPEKLCLNKIVDECISLIHSNAKAKQIVIQNEVPVDLTVSQDRFVLSTVINNLCGNAVKYTPRGGHIWMRANQEANQVVIRVTDEGIGMTPQLLADLFCSRGSNSRAGTDEESGTGLGLMICHELVTQTGGQIWAESPGEGQGTTFVVSLPTEAA
jgi:signal transduction histidine kinase